MNRHETNRIPQSPIRDPQSLPITRRAALALGATVAAGILVNPRLLAASTKRRVVVWSEGSANVDPNSKKVYPDDINTAIAQGLEPLKGQGWEVVKASLHDPDQGLDDEGLHGHRHPDLVGTFKKHGEVKDELVSRIEHRVKEEGMGFIGTHSAHFCKPLKRLLGTACSWREYVLDGTTVEVIVKDPKHPICKGVSNFTIPIERYGGSSAVPTPEAEPLDGIYQA